MVNGTKFIKNWNCCLLQKNEDMLLIFFGFFTMKKKKRNSRGSQVLSHSDASYCFWIDQNKKWGDASYCFWIDQHKRLCPNSDYQEEFVVIATSFSRLVGREKVLRYGSRIHPSIDDVCSCKDFWQRRHLEAGKRGLWSNQPLIDIKGLFAGLLLLPFVKEYIKANF